MNMAVRRFFVRNPILRGFYVKARTVYNRRRFLGRAKRLLVNVDDYRKALVSEDGEVVDIHTKDGLTLSIRRNVIDAVILGENYLDNSYVRGLTLPERPTVVDVGGFIGDFAVYAVKYLNARKVVVYEPSQQNWVLLQRNVANNQLQDRIRTVNKVVTDGHDILLNVDVSARSQHRVSAYYPSQVERRSIPGVSLTGIVKDHELTVIDLLKIDCEGSEYDILSSTSAEILARVRNLVFEYHEIDGFRAKLDAVKRQLCHDGFVLTTRGSLVFAVR